MQKSYLTALLGKNRNELSKKHPPKFSIVKHGDNYYQYIGSHHKTARDDGIKRGDKVEAGGGYVTDYDPTGVDYMYVRAIVEHDDGMYYFIPSRYSEIGTWDPSKREYVLIESDPWYSITYLDESICVEKYPHLMY